MAQAIACDLCQQEAAVMLETRIETGEVIAVGAACLIPFYVGAAGSLYDQMDHDDAAAFVPAILALSDKWVNAGDTSTAGDSPDVSAEGVLTPDEITKIIADDAEMNNDDAILAGSEDVSVSGEGITVTADQPARTARNRARTPK